MDNSEEGYSLILSFPDQSPSFVHGFEAGTIFQRMSENEPIIDKGFIEDFPVREENLELYQRMSAYKDYSLETRESEHGWVAIRFTKNPKSKPNLKLVQN